MSVRRSVGSVAMGRPLSRRSFGDLLAAGLAVRPALAGGLGVPQEKPVLTISGRIDVRNDGDVARFDRPMLEALGTRGFVTSTPWLPYCMDLGCGRDVVARTWAPSRPVHGTVNLLD